MHLENSHVYISFNPNQSMAVDSLPSLYQPLLFQKKIYLLIYFKYVNSLQAGDCDCCDEISGSKKCGEFLD